MNFVGHAHIALTLRSDPAFVLGSMLPDFASMGRTRLEGVDDPDVAEGVALHHRTDDAFHGCPAFVRLCTETSTSLEQQGVPWGAARAVGHVGTELLLDGFLLDAPGTHHAASEAVRALERPAITASIRVHSAGAERWAELLARVRGRGLPDFYRDPDAVADRLIAILAPRPRLAVGEEHRGTLRAAMRALRPLVERDTNSMVEAAQSGCRRAPIIAPCAPTR